MEAAPQAGSGQDPDEWRAVPPEGDAVGVSVAGAAVGVSMGPAVGNTVGVLVRDAIGQMSVEAGTTPSFENDDMHRR